MSAHTSEQLADLDAGYWFSFDNCSYPYRGQNVRIPKLETVLNAYPSHRFNIEIKQESPNIVGKVIEVVDSTCGRERVLLAAESDSIMKTIREVAGPRLLTGMSVGEVTTFMDRYTRADWAGYRPPGRALQIPVRFADFELVTAGTTAAAHQVGLEVHVWTVNESAEIVRLLELGVDGIMSDLPGLVVAALDRTKPN